MTSPENDKRTPIWKVLLIPILLVGLIWNVTRDTDDVPALAVVEQPPDPSQTDAVDVVSVTELLRELQRVRQVEAAGSPLQPEQVVGHDPFSLVGKLAERSGISTLTESVAVTAAPLPASPGDGEVLTQVLKSSVKAVLNGPHGAVALVDSRIVRVGDYLEPDVRIVAIQSDAIVVEVTKHGEDAL